MTLFNSLRFITEHPLNRDQKLRAIMRVAKWQIWSRLAPGKITHDWVNGSKFMAKKGDAGLTGNIYTGLHEFYDMGFLLHFLRIDDLFIDVGANLGSYTILACSAVGSRGIAFEPAPRTYKRLAENIHLNHLGERVRCINQGVGAQQGTITFTTDNDTTNHVLASGERCNGQATIKVTTLDKALDRENPSLIKIDVEGYETQVLRGAQKTLETKSLNAVIIELNGAGQRYGFDESKIPDMMLSLGFKAYSYNPFDRELVSLERRKAHTDNVLFIRNKQFVDQRLKSAPRVKINGREF